MKIRMTRNTSLGGGKFASVGEIVDIKDEVGLELIHKGRAEFVSMMRAELERVENRLLGTAGANLPEHERETIRHLLADLRKAKETKTVEEAPDPEMERKKVVPIRVVRDTFIRGKSVYVGDEVKVDYETATILLAGKKADLPTDLDLKDFEVSLERARLTDDRLTVKDRAGIDYLLRTIRRRQLLEPAESLSQQMAKDSSGKKK